MIEGKGTFAIENKSMKMLALCYEILLKKEDIMTNNSKKIDVQISKTMDALKENGFDVWFANNKLEAREIFWKEIFEKRKPQSISWGDSLTMQSLGILDKLSQLSDIEFIETFGEHLTRREEIDNRKKALSADMFLTGSNALTMKGQLVNLDMVGNRVAGITFGPRNVVLFIGVNKIVENIDEAIDRVKSIAAPLNVKRHKDMKNPCATTGKCMDCKSPQRICNTWVITEKSYPLGRIKIILIHEKLGL